MCPHYKDIITLITFYLFWTYDNFDSPLIIRKFAFVVLYLSRHKSTLMSIFGEMLDINVHLKYQLLMYGFLRNFLSVWQYITLEISNFPYPEYQLFLCKWFSLQRIITLKITAINWSLLCEVEVSWFYYNFHNWSLPLQVKAHS